MRVRISQLLGVAVAYFFITWGWATAWGVVGERVSRGLREALLRKAVGMEVGWFDVECPDVSCAPPRRGQVPDIDILVVLDCKPSHRGYPDDPARHVRESRTVFAVVCVLCCRVHHRFHPQCPLNHRLIRRGCPAHVRRRIWRL